MNHQLLSDFQINSLAQIAPIEVGSGSSNLTIIGGETSLDAPEFAFPPIIRAVRFLDNPDAIMFLETQIALSLAVE